MSDLLMATSLVLVASLVAFIVVMIEPGSNEDWYEPYEGDDDL